MTSRFRALRAGGVLAAVPCLAAAQMLSFGEVDADGNGTLGPSELAAVFGDEGAAKVLARQDTDGDGLLTRAEAVARPDAADETPAPAADSDPSDTPPAPVDNRPSRGPDDDGGS